MKSSVDKIIEETIIENLLPTGITVLSEESGEFRCNSESSLRFVVDPLDGTVNFVRGLGPCSISIALCDNDKPIFGVLAIYPSGDFAWGGIGKGAFLNKRPIHVSKITDPFQTVLCTGFPSRYSFEDHNSVKKHVRMMSHFGKVRMLGSASNSLLQVAKGAAEVYSEKEIMLWDVAAGLAILEGAGGEFDINFGKDENAVNVSATNGLINIAVPT
jgi:myo-inositol-1(or 4)-monophosphatase